MERERALNQPKMVRWLIIAGALGMLCRVALAACSEGTNDAGTWARFGKEIVEKGIIDTYRDDPRFNHPPLAGYWALHATQLVRRSGLSFSFIFKLPVIVADCGSAVLLYAVWRRAGRAQAAMALALFAWNLDAILVSGYHCNTDPIYAFLCLLSVWLIEEKGRDFWAGVALAAAINIKLIPILLVVPLALQYRDADAPKRLARFFLGLSAGVIPFIPIVLNASSSFKHNSLDYNGSMSGWGIAFLLQKIGALPIPGKHGARLDLRALYFEKGKYILLVLVFLLAVVGRRRRWDRYTLAAATALSLLVIGPGFGVQYTSLAAVLLTSMSLRVGSLYGAVMGAFLAATYLGFWTGSFPLSSNFTGDFPNAVRPFRLGVWAGLLLILAHLVRRRQPLLRPARETSGSECSLGQGRVEAAPAARRIPS